MTYAISVSFLACAMLAFFFSAAETKQERFVRQTWYGETEGDSFLDLMGVGCSRLMA